MFFLSIWLIGFKVSLPHYFVRLAKFHVSEEKNVWLICLYFGFTEISARNWDLLRRDWGYSQSLHKISQLGHSERDYFAKERESLILAKILEAYATLVMHCNIQCIWQVVYSQEEKETATPETQHSLQNPVSVEILQLTDSLAQLVAAA